MMRSWPPGGATLISGAPLTNPPRLHASRPVHPSRGPRLGLPRCVGQAFAAEAIAECIRSGSVWETESNIEWLDLSGRGGLGCVVHGGTHQSVAKHRESLPTEVRVRPDAGSPVRSLAGRTRFCDESSRPILVRFALTRRTSRFLLPGAH